jgi:hypothetical protein
MHLICFWALRAGASWEVLRVVMAIGGAATGIFALLAANEILGNPPLMTPGFHASNLQGEWRGKGRAGDLRMTIHPDGSIAGTLDGVSVSAGRMQRNRTWFGRLMHWRTDYLVDGSLAGERFTAPMMHSGADLSGSLFLKNRPHAVLLTRVAAEEPADFGAWWRTFQAAVARGDGKAVAAAGHYPLDWEIGPVRRIETAQKLIDHFGKYFTPEIRRMVATKTPEREPTGNYVITWKARGNEYSLYYKPEGGAFVMDGLSEGPG